MAILRRLIAVLGEEMRETSAGEGSCLAPTLCEGLREWSSSPKCTRSWADYTGSFIFFAFMKSVGTFVFAQLPINQRYLRIRELL